MEPGVPSHSHWSIFLMDMGTQCSYGSLIHHGLICIANPVWTHALAVSQGINHQTLPYIAQWTAHCIYFLHCHHLVVSFTSFCMVAHTLPFCISSFKTAFSHHHENLFSKLLSEFPTLMHPTSATCIPEHWVFHHIPTINPTIWSCLKRFLIDLFSSSDRLQGYKKHENIDNKEVQRYHTILCKKTVCSIFENLIKFTRWSCHWKKTAAWLSIHKAILCKMNSSISFSHPGKKWQISRQWNSSPIFPNCLKWQLLSSSIQMGKWKYWHLNFVKIW